MFYLDFFYDSTVPTFPPGASPYSSGAGELLQDVFDLFSMVISFCLDSFWGVLDSLGFTGAFISVFFITVTYNFLLKPLFGGSGSDRVKKPKE